MRLVARRLGLLVSSILRLLLERLLLLTGESSCLRLQSCLRIAGVLLLELGLLAITRGLCAKLRLSLELLLLLLLLLLLAILRLAGASAIGAAEIRVGPGEHCNHKRDMQRRRRGRIVMQAPFDDETGER